MAKFLTTSVLDIARFADASVHSINMSWKEERIFGCKNYISTEIAAQVVTLFAASYLSKPY